MDYILYGKPFTQRDVKQMNTTHQVDVRLGPKFRSTPLATTTLTKDFSAKRPATNGKGTGKGSAATGGDNQDAAAAILARTRIKVRAPGDDTWGTTPDWTGATSAGGTTGAADTTSATSATTGVLGVSWKTLLTVGIGAAIALVFANNSKGKIK